MKSETLVAGKMIPHDEFLELMHDANDVGVLINPSLTHSALEGRRLLVEEKEPDFKCKPGMVQERFGLVSVG